MQVNEPAVFAQVAFSLQSCNIKLHSSTSISHFAPTKPVMQLHVNEPLLFMHTPCPLTQLCEPTVHSSTSEHVAPLPEYPKLHVHERPVAVLPAGGGRSVHLAVGMHGKLTHASIRSMQVNPLPV